MTVILKVLFKTIFLKYNFLPVKVSQLGIAIATKLSDKKLTAELYYQNKTLFQFFFFIVKSRVVCLDDNVNNIKV